MPSSHIASSRVNCRRGLAGSTLVPSPGDLPNPGIETVSLVIEPASLASLVSLVSHVLAGGSFTASAT